MLKKVKDMPDLIIDIGNTLTKIAVMESKQLLTQISVPVLDKAVLDELLGRYALQRAIIASTGGGREEVQELLQRHIGRVICLDAKSRLPIGIEYATPQTLGADRVALAVGACEELGYDKKILVVDLGTAITIDRVENGVFRGGNISPGVWCRFRALHEFTQSLPQCSPVAQTPFFGDSTRSAIESGVMNGVVYEIEGYIERLRCENRDFFVIFTGGDANFFVNRIKSAIFVSQNLMFYGLSKILEYNATNNND